MYYKYFAVGLMLLTISMLSCKKEKVDYSYDNRPDIGVGGSSTIRLVNCTQNNQLSINGEKLTSYLIINPPQGEQALYPGTYWFPTNGKLGASFTVPRQFLTNGSAMISTDYLAYSMSRDSFGFKVIEEYNKPKDYFMVYGLPYSAEKVSRVREVPREITAPSKAGYFKIRIVNLADKVSAAWNAENVAKPLTLAYADGTPVSSTTSNIDPQSWSQYVELPYGTYQFKVLTQEGIEVRASGGDAFENTFMSEPASSNLMRAVSGVPNAVSTGLTYAPVKTYQPGGVYTIVVGIDRLTMLNVFGIPGETSVYYQNIFRVLSDVSEPLNTDYYRLQGVQANPEEGQISFRVNGTKLADANYTAATDYSIYVAGQATIEAVNASGNVLATATQRFQAGQNITAWFYKKPEGKPAIGIVTNNLTGSWYQPLPGGDNTGQDGSLNRMTHNYPFNYRFLNLCPDLPYVSFTYDNGQSFGDISTSRNLQPGVAVTNLPYARGIQDQEAFQIMAYKSTPSVYPGSWISSIPVLKSTDFIAHPERYTRVKPVHEPGVYTVALVGQLNGNQPEAKRAKMIIIKHTK
ncbi:DUF4397 domain-containing protein [Chitinophaga silvatica]|uniref:DUF4397 domain-containing protein n=1 Tax=Chitinophaga silvatica TaxID=2282649 RepID=A0A3E1Y8N4_9BACT|nr:DUF4397 domain-containing protein [Chitinophaga silvatica]RFS21711.1 DUF4397 domain-containing protein [Chitinophaga silvatica]